jgi:N-succinyldiaminopimelate aminotransferase
LLPYPFERLNALKAGVTGNPGFSPVALSIGEPRHPPPAFIIDLLADREALERDLGVYPATRGSIELREAVSAWIERRFDVRIDPESEVLPVAGTREALFSFAQTLLTGTRGSVCLVPNPFYQIYEGAAYLGGATPYFLNTSAENAYLPDYRSVPDSIWRRCELLYVCSPGNPTGRVLPIGEMIWLLEMARRWDFVIAADECYSEIYLDESRPPGGFLQAARAGGCPDYAQLVVFHSLSKRSNLPGLRSGFVAGDARILERYFRYRTYEGCALPAHVARVSAAAWADEHHVAENRARYRETFAAVTPRLRQVFEVTDPEGGFYHWLRVAGDDCEFALRLFAQTNITVLPGSFIARESLGVNPGYGHVRVAWVAESAACLDAANRLVSWASQAT